MVDYGAAASDDDGLDCDYCHYETDLDVQIEENYCEKHTELDTVVQIL